MPKLKLTKQDSEKIESAVKEAESKTSGEIATALIKESDNYAIYELSFAVFAGFIYFLVLMAFSDSIEYRIQQMVWDYSSRYLLMFYGFSIFVVIALVYLMVNIPFLDRLVIPKGVMRKKVSQRAVRHFMESGVYDTRDRTGILIFISKLERRVELLADKGISEKIPQEKWDGILAHIIDGIKTDHVADHLAEAIKECGELLATHFPIQPDDVNELNDGIQVLEK